MASTDEPPPVAAALELLEGHRELTTGVKATQARHDFFALLQQVVADPARVVEVEYKGLPVRVLMVHEDYRAYVRELERAVRGFATSSQESPAFHLAGSLSVRGEVDDAVDMLRADERTHTGNRFRDV